MALRYDPSPESIYSRLAALPEFSQDVIKLFRDDGSPLFTGQGRIPGTDLESSGSAKDDAYPVLTNASFHQHFPLKEHYPQNPQPTISDLKSCGLVLPDDRVKLATYVASFTWVITTAVLG